MYPSKAGLMRLVQHEAALLVLFRLLESPRGQQLAAGAIALHQATAHLHPTDQAYLLRQWLRHPYPIRIEYAHA